MIANDKTATEQVPMSGGTFKEIAWDLNNRTLYRGAFFNIVQYAVDPLTAVVGKFRTDDFASSEPRSSIHCA